MAKRWSGYAKEFMRQKLEGEVLRLENLLPDEGRGRKTIALIYKANGSITTMPTDKLMAVMDLLCRTIPEEERT